MGYVYISYAMEDADKVGPLADAIRAEGWGVRFAPLVDPGAKHKRRMQLEISGARALIAIWSRHSVESARVKIDAQFAYERGRLISVRLDDARLPVAGAVVIDLFDGSEASHVVGSRAILDAIAASTMVPVVSRGRKFTVIPTVVGAEGDAAAAAEKTPPRKKRGFVVPAGIASVVVLAGIFAGVALFGGGSEHRAQAGKAVAEAERAATDVDGSAASSRDIEALEKWGHVNGQDPLAVRAFLSAYGETSVAERARSALSRLERNAWEKVQAATDSAAVLTAVDAYRGSFSDGVFRKQTDEIDRAHGASIAEVQRLLSASGFHAGLADGVPRPETVAAVRAFQSASGLKATGLIDAGLLEALRSSRVVSSGKEEGKAEGKPGETAVPSAVAPPPAVVADKPRGSVTPVTGISFRDCYTCPEMVPLPPGDFVMGDATGRADADERPAHRVVIDYRLAVGKYEVTFEEWDACVEEGGCRRRPSDQGLGRGAMPVVDINAADVAEYLGWLEMRTGKRYRLLSEAEWEYAAKADAASSAWISGNDPAGICEYGNGADASSTYEWRNTTCKDRWGARPAPVGTFKPNAWGLHDMLGNVWELTADCWHPGYSAAPTDGSAWTRDCVGSDRVLRGGAYSVDVDKLRLTFRYHFGSRRMPFFGVRVARVLD